MFPSSSSKAPAVDALTDRTSNLTLTNVSIPSVFLPDAKMAHTQPMDASKLNHTPAPLPLPPSPEHRNDEPSPPLRSTDGVGRAGDSPSGYLDEEAPAPLHPTVAETGALASPTGGPGPSHGQLQRRESQPTRRIIRLASFGGEGLVAKPPPPQDAVDEAIE